jgi:hypothetical protein
MRLEKSITKENEGNEDESLDDRGKGESIWKSGTQGSQAD